MKFGRLLGNKHMDVTENTIFKFADLEDRMRRRDKIMILLKQADGESGLNFT